MRPHELPGPWTGALVLAGLGAVLLAGCLYLNLIALGGPLGAAPEWVERLTLPAELLHEALAGPVPRDVWAVTGQQVRLRQALLALAVMGAGYLLAVLFVVRRRGQLGARAVDVVWTVAVVARVVLVAAPPLLETDPYRYLWDGAVATAGVSPYAHPPAAVLSVVLGHPPPPGLDPGQQAELVRLAGLAGDPGLGGALARINHPHLPTCYPPAAELLFELSQRLSPGSVQAWKALVALLDLAVLWLLGRLLAARGRPPEELIAYAWCPIVLKELAGSGHYDALAVVATLAGVLALVEARPATAGAWLGLGIAAKLYPLALVLALAPRLRARGLALAVAVPLGLAFPYLRMGLPRPEGAAAFATGWVRNAPVFPVLAAVSERLLGPGEAAGLLARGLAGALLGLGLVALARRSLAPEADPVAIAYGAAALVFLLSPVANPWYLPWVLPLATAAGSFAWPILGTTMTAHYGWYVTPRPGGLLLLLEYGAFAAAGLWEARDRLVRGLLAGERGEENPPWPAPPVPARL